MTDLAEFRADLESLWARLESRVIELDAEDIAASAEIAELCARSQARHNAIFAEVMGLYAQIEGRIDQECGEDGRLDPLRLDVFGDVMVKLNAVMDMVYAKQTTHPYAEQRAALEDVETELEDVHSRLRAIGERIALNTPGGQS